VAKLTFFGNRIRFADVIGKAAAILEADGATLDALRELFKAHKVLVRMEEQANSVQRRRIRVMWLLYVEVRNRVWERDVEYIRQAESKIRQAVSYINDPGFYAGPVRDDPNGFAVLKASDVKEESSDGKM